MRKASKILEDKPSSASPEPEQAVGHLNEKTLAYLELADAERIEKIRSPRWIGYARAKEIHERLDELFHHPKVSRMPSVLVCGASNAGKSVLVERFVNQKNDTGTDEPILPVLMVQAPYKPTPRDFFGICLEKVGTVYPASHREDRLRKQLATVLANLQTRMLVIDEVHHLLAGSGTGQHEFMNMMKFLSNDLRIPIVAIGTKDALIAFRTDDQIANRFEPLPIPRWELGVGFTRLLASFEVTTPLRRPSNLAGEHLASKLRMMSGGLIGELAELLRRASVAAIKSGRECIDFELLDSLGWVLPSERRDDAMKLI